MASIQKPLPNFNKSADYIKQRNTRDILKKWLRLTPSYLIFGFWSLFTIFCILWIINSAFKTNMELFKNVWALPKQLQIQNFVKAWDNLKLDVYFKNSLVLVSASTFLIL